MSDTKHYGDFVSHTSPLESEILWHTGAQWGPFVGAEAREPASERFEVYGVSRRPVDDEIPAGPEWADAYAYWCHNSASALLLAMLHRSWGHKAVILWDLAQPHTDESNWLVVSTKNWEDESPVPTPTQLAQRCRDEGHDWDDARRPRKATMEDYTRPSTCLRCGTVRQRNGRGGATYTMPEQRP